MFSPLAYAQEVNSNGLYWNFQPNQHETWDVSYHGVLGSNTAADVNVYYVDAANLSANLSSWRHIYYSFSRSGGFEDMTDLLCPLILPENDPVDYMIYSELIGYPFVLPVGNWSHLSELVASEYDSLNLTPMESATFWGFEVDTEIHTNHFFHPNFNVSLYCRVGYLKSDGVISFISINMTDLSDNSVYQSTEMVCTSIMSDDIFDDMTEIPGWWNNYGADVYVPLLSDYLLRLAIIGCIVVLSYFAYHRFNRRKNEKYAFRKDNHRQEHSDIEAN